MTESTTSVVAVNHPRLGRLTFTTRAEAEAYAAVTGSGIEAPQARTSQGLRLRDTPIRFAQYKGLTFEEVRQLERGGLHRVGGHDFKSHGEAEAFVVGTNETPDAHGPLLWATQITDVQDPAAAKALFAAARTAHPASPEAKAYRLGVAHKARRLSPLGITSYKALTDFDGVRYLDWLLGQPWLYPDTRARLEAYMSHPNLAADLAAAFSTQVRDDRGGLFPEAMWYDQLMTCNYGDGESLISSDFSPIAQLEENDKDPWQAHGTGVVWLAAPNGDDRRSMLARARKFTASDPTPAEWDLRGGMSGGRVADHGNDLDAAARFQLEGGWEEDDWQDQYQPADNDVEWDAEPTTPPAAVRNRVNPAPGAYVGVVKTRRHKQLVTPQPETVSHDAWTRAMALCQRLEALGECRGGNARTRQGPFAWHKTVRDAWLAAGGPARGEEPLSPWQQLDELKAESKRLLCQVEYRQTGEAYHTWHPNVPEGCRKLVSEAVFAAQARLDALYVGETEEAGRDLDLARRAKAIGDARPGIEAQCATLHKAAGLTLAECVEAALVSEVAAQAKAHRAKYGLADQAEDWAGAAEAAEALEVEIQELVEA